MTPEEEAYEEALRRIREAEETGAVELDLSGWKEGKSTGLKTLNRLPPELERLTSLRSLNFSSCVELTGGLSPLASLTSLQLLNLNGCYQLSGDLSSLVKLTSLQLLDLSGCRQLSGDLTPLADLTSLQTLNLSSCEQLSDLSPLAGLTSLQWLDLGGCRQISNVSPLANLTLLRQLGLSVCDRVSDISPLTKLTELQYLNLSGCGQLSDLAPLVNLTALQKLDISCCHRLSNLSPLATLTGLQQLNLHYCKGVRQFCHLKPLLPRLQVLNLARCQFNDLPAEVCGEHDWQNVVDKVRAHYEDLKSGQQNDAEVKVFLLGNGGVGKTQLCRRLRGLEFDDKNVSSTHGIQLSDITLSLEGFSEPVRLNFWDFGGQEIYHGSHALFLHGQAIFLVLWTPELEQGETYQESGLTLRHRPLTYWLDFAGTDASVLIVQSQCDTRDKRILHPPAPVGDFPFHRCTEVSARTGLNLGILKESIKEAVRDRFDRRPSPPIGQGRLKVRDRLRVMLEEDQKRESNQRQHRLLERAAFDRICNEVGGVSDKNALLDFLHHNGVIFYQPGLFGGRIILDQNWALEAIYSIFHRDKCFKQLKKLHGRFNREDLELLIWSGYTPDEQKVFLGMMESCGICFRVRELPQQEQLAWWDKEWEYIAPELLPTWSETQKSLLTGRIPKDHPIAEAEARYAFLHEGVLRGYLSRIGQQAGDAAIYWKYGCWSYEETTDSRVLIESQWDDAESEAGTGSIRLRAWGQNAESLIDPLLEALQKLPAGQPPEIKRTKAIALHGTARASASITARLDSDPPAAEPSAIVRQGGLKQLDRPAQIKLEDLIFTRDPQSSPAAGLTTADNTSHTDYSAPVRDAPQTTTSPKTSTIQEVVLLIHGIRDFAEWQDMVATVLSEIPNIEVCPLKYGRFDAFRFWFPLWTREAPVKNLLWRIRSAQDRFSPAKMSVVAHSFGTYAIGNILRENPDIRLHRLILCGSILPAGFRWDKIQHSVEMPIINDCGIRDFWPVLAQSTTFGYGPSGRFGFGTPGVRDRYHDFGHGGFFQEKFVSDFWLPWFRSGNFVKSKAPLPSGARWHLLTIFPIKWIAVLVCLLGLLASWPTFFGNAFAVRYEVNALGDFEGTLETTVEHLPFSVSSNSLNPTRDGEIHSFYVEFTCPEGAFNIQSQMVPHFANVRAFHGYSSSTTSLKVTGTGYVEARRLLSAGPAPAETWGYFSLDGSYDIKKEHRTPVKGKPILTSVLTHNSVKVPVPGGLGHLKSLTITVKRLGSSETLDSLGADLPDDPTDTLPLTSQKGLFKARISNQVLEVHTLISQ